MGLLAAAPGVAFITALFLPQLDPGFSAKQLQVGHGRCVLTCVGALWQPAVVVLRSWTHDSAQSSCR